MTILRWIASMFRWRSSSELHEAIARHREAAMENETTAERVTDKKEAERFEREQLNYVLDRVIRRVGGDRRR